MRATEARAARIRQYEDFFNASGMATPDDCEEFRSCQKTFLATAAPWNDMSRGASHWIEGGDDEAKQLGLDPVSTGVKTEDEGLYITQHSYWQKEMQKAVKAEIDAELELSAAESNGSADSNGQAQA